MHSFLGGLGAIFMLHHVLPGGGLQTGFAPNKALEVTPEFLDAVIGLARQRGFDLLSMAQAVERLRQPEVGQRPFVVFTLDDAYKDNMVHAAPVFARHQCPFTIFASPAIQDGTCELWWRGLEAAIAANATVRGSLNGEAFAMSCATPAQKLDCWNTLYWPVRNLEQKAQRQWIRLFCTQNNIDLTTICTSQAMTWDELRRMAQHPLCTIGAHTVNHFAVGRLQEADALFELAESRRRLAAELGRAPAFLAYPYGDAGSAGPRDFALAREAGFEAAVTTRKGMLFPAHKDHLLALPRLSLSGDFQKLRYVDVLLSGSAFALLNGFRQLNVA
jgi:peptidoglycan/xylan/chitin deacetylase (PgdA/CDA1 family)